MKQDAKYLRITIHDNDFRISLLYVGKLLCEIFQNEGKYPTEEYLPYIKEYIKHMWWSIHATTKLMRWGVDYVESHEHTQFDYFEPHLQFVDYLDIPDCDNSESIYIPMFDNAHILLR